MNMHRRPEIDFIVIGAIKAATTWLQVQLQNHRQLFLPDIEPHFFTRDFEKGWDWYRDLFPSERRQGTLWGEKTADYLANPLAAARIAEYYPEAKLIVQFRHPVDRAYSDYKMLYRRGTVNDDPRMYLDRKTGPVPRFLDNGRYAHHLKRWLDLFPRENIHALLFEDVKCAPRDTLEKVCGHLGVAMDYDENLAARSQNDSSEEFLPLPIRRAFAPLKPIARPMRGNALFEKTRGLLARKVDYPPLSRDLRLRLQDFYADDICELERLLGRDLSRWKEAGARSNAA